MERKVSPRSTKFLKWSNDAQAGESSTRSPSSRARGGGKHRLAEIVDLPDRQRLGVIQRRFCHGIVNFLRGKTGKEQCLDMAADLVAELVERDMLIVPARNRMGFCRSA